MECAPGRGQPTGAARREQPLKIRNEKDFWSGVMFVAAGLFFAIYARKYDLGTAHRMGPGYFPTMLGILLAVLGGVIAFTGLSREGVDGKVQKFHLAQAGWVLGAVVVFGLLLIPAGALVAIFALVVISSLGSHEFRWKEAIALAVVMAIVTWAVFIWALGVTVPVWPAFMNR
jgi:hypothetical protein